MLTTWVCVCQKNIVTVRARTKWKHVGDCCLLPQGFSEAAVFSLISLLCHLVLVWARLHFHPPPGSCDVRPAAPGLQRVSLMTGLIPLMQAACVQAPCSWDTLAAERFARHGLKTDRCCSAQETRGRMWLWLNTERLVVWSNASDIWGCCTLSV